MSNSTSDTIEWMKNRLSIWNLVNNPHFRILFSLHLYRAVWSTSIEGCQLILYKSNIKNMFKMKLFSSKMCGAQSPQSCPTLCDPMDCSPPGSSVHGILQARILEWVAMPSSRGSSWPRDQTGVSCNVGGFFTHFTWEVPVAKCAVSIAFVDIS